MSEKTHIPFEYFLVFKEEKWVENQKNARCFQPQFQNDVSTQNVTEFSEKKEENFSLFLLFLIFFFFNILTNDYSLNCV